MSRQVIGCEENGAQTIVIWRNKGRDIIDLLATAPGESEYRSFDAPRLDYVFRVITDTVLRCGQNLIVHIGVATYHAEIRKEDDGSVTVDWVNDGAESVRKYASLRCAFRSSGLI